MVIDLARGTSAAAVDVRLFGIEHAVSALRALHIGEVLPADSVLAAGHSVRTFAHRPAFRALQIEIGARCHGERHGERSDESHGSSPRSATCVQAEYPL